MNKKKIDCTSVSVIIADEDTSQMLVRDGNRPEPFLCEVEGDFHPNAACAKRDVAAENAAHALVRMRTGLDATSLKRIARVISRTHDIDMTVSYDFIAFGRINGSMPKNSHLEFLVLDIENAEYAHYPGIVGFAIDKLHERKRVIMFETDYCLD